MQFAVITGALLFATWCILRCESVDFLEKNHECTVSCKTVKNHFDISSTPPKNLCLYTKGKKGQKFVVDIEVLKDDYDYCRMCVELKDVEKVEISYRETYKSKTDIIDKVRKEFCFEKSNLESLTATFIPKSNKKVVIVDFIFGCCKETPDCASALRDGDIGPLLLAAFLPDGLQKMKGAGCSCTSFTHCSCCAGISKPVQIDACGVFMIDGNDLIFQVTINKKVIKQWIISVRDPPPLCVKIPKVPFAELCAVVYDVEIPPPIFKACLKFEAKLFGRVVFTIDIGCFTKP